PCPAHRGGFPRGMHLACAAGQGSADSCSVAGGAAETGEAENYCSGAGKAGESTSSGPGPSPGPVPGWSYRRRRVRDGDHAGPVHGGDSLETTADLLPGGDPLQH
ncbi:unnamed protein product, partial [Symbiodinium necroappetens]